MMVTGERVWTPEEVAEYLGVSLKTIMNYLRDKKLKGFKVGRLWRIHDRDLQAFMTQGEPEGGTEGES